MPFDLSDEDRTAAAPRRKSARSNSKQVAAHNILCEVEVQVQRLRHLVTPPPDAETALLLAAKQVYGLRRVRARIFGADLFADPSWDILLDLFIAKREGRKVTISSACLASAAPTTTATRHISHLVQLGLVARIPHPNDARSSYIELTAKGDRKLTQMFREMEQTGDDPA